MSVKVWKNIVVLRGLAVLLVVLAHSIKVSFTLGAAGAETLSFGEHPWTFAVLFPLWSLVNACLGAFLVASGFVVARMYAGYKGVYRSALHLLRKYLTWAVPLYLLLSLREESFDLAAVAQGLAKGGPMSAYWFIVLLLVLYLAVPIFVRLARWSQPLTLLLAAVLQVAAWCRYYLEVPQAPFLIEYWVVRSLTLAPYFLVGMLLGMNVRRVVSVLEGRRTLLSWLLVASALLCMAESYWWGRSIQWATADVPGVFATDRLSLTIFAWALVLHVLMAKGVQGPARRWLDHVGVKTLGVLFLTDLCIRSYVCVLWHAPGWFSDDAQALICGRNPPALLRETALLWLAPCVCAGLLGPLWLMRFAERVFGKRARWLW